jgi:hypothetical protein
VSGDSSATAAGRGGGSSPRSALRRAGIAPRRSASSRSVSGDRARIGRAGRRGHLGHAVRCFLGPGRGRETVAAAQELAPPAALRFFVPVPVAPGRSRSRFRRCAVFSCSRQVAVLFPGALIRFPGPGAPGVSRSCLRPCRIFLSGPSCARQVVAPCPALLICFSGAQLPPAGRGPVSGCIDSLSQGDVTCPQHFAVLRPAAMIPGAQLHVAFYGLSSDCVDCSPGARRRQRVAVLSRRR